MGACSLLKKQKQTKKIPKKIFPSPQYFKMMVLLLYIQNQDKQKMTKKNQIKFPEKKNSESCYYPKQPQKSLNNYKKFCHTPQFFLQVMNKILERKKNNQKTKQAREKEIMFLFLTPRFRKKKTTTKLQNPRKHKKQANKKNKNPVKKPNEIYS